MAKGPQPGGARKLGPKRSTKIVIGAAQRVGLKKENPSIADAIRFLEKTFPFVGDKLTPAFGGGLQHHLRDFSHHPSPVGIVCSILMQFTGKGFGTATDGSFLIVDLPGEALKDGMLFGRNAEEKFLYGTLNWVLHLISDMAGSSSTPGAGTGIPGPILSFLKEASALPFFQDMSIAYEDKVATFSQWVSKAFNGTLLRTRTETPCALICGLRLAWRVRSSRRFPPSLRTSVLSAASTRSRVLSTN